MTDRVDAYASAIFEVAKAEGSLDEVADELFRFARIFEANDELRNALTDQALPPERRQAIVEDLLGGKALPLTTSLISFVVAAGRGRDLPKIVNQLVERAAAEREHVVAEVKAAVELAPEQRERLEQALSVNLGKNVEVKVIVDPSVLGGIVARIGDTVIDGSVRHRLDQLKESL
jgi:F-type H+-transporting ATPase subunit delta